MEPFKAGVQNMKKKISVWMCLLAAVFLMAGCTTVTNGTKEIKNADSIQSSAKEYLDSWNATDFQLYLTDYIDELSEESQKQCNDFIKIKEKVGGFVSVTSEEMKEVENKSEGKTQKGIDVVYQVKYEKGETAFKVHFDTEGNYQGVTVTYSPTLAEKFQNAGINTMLGMGIVLFVLFFMSFVISLFKLIPKYQEKRAEKKKAEVENVPFTLPEDLKEAETLKETEASFEECVEDEQLAAVITAAIIAYEGQQSVSDGFVVRSIKRRKGNNWKNSIS